LEDHLKTSPARFVEHKVGLFEGAVLPEMPAVPAEAIRIGYTSKDYAPPTENDEDETDGQSDEDSDDDSDDEEVEE